MSGAQGSPQRPGRGRGLPACQLLSWGFLSPWGGEGEAQVGMGKGSGAWKQREDSTCPARAPGGLLRVGAIPSCCHGPSRARGPPGPGDTQRQVGSQPSYSLRWGWGLSSMALGSVCPGFRVFWKALWHPGPREVGGLPSGMAAGPQCRPREAGLCRLRGAGGDSMNPAGLRFLASYLGGLGPGGCFLGSGRAPTRLPGPQPCGLCQAVVGDCPPAPLGSRGPGKSL